jgi:hypothetical protein
MGLHDIIKEVGGYVGSISGPIVGYIYKRYLTTETNAVEALKIATKLEKELDLGILRQLVENHKAITSSRSDFEDNFTLSRRIAELNDDVDELKRSLNELVKGDLSSWKELYRSLGEIEGRLKEIQEKKK